MKMRSTGVGVAAGMLVLGGLAAGPARAGRDGKPAPKQASPAKGGGRAGAAPALASDPDLRGEPALEAVRQLEWTRGSAADVLAFMKSDDPRVRARAALALARLQDWSAAEALVPYLADADPEVRKASAFALGELDPVMPLLLTQIKAGRKGDDPSVRGPAMARAAAEKKVDARLHLEERGDVRRALYSALGPLAVGAGLHHLQFGLEGSADEAGWAGRALGVHGHRRKGEAVQDKEIHDTLHKLLDSPKEDTRFGASYALFRLGGKDVPGLSERLGTDPDVRVRINAARGLSGKKGGEDALAVAFRDPDWRVRVEAARGLAEAEKPRGLTSKEDVAAVGAAGREALRVLLGTSGLNGATMAHVVITVCGVLAKAPPFLALPHLDGLAEMVGLPQSSGVPSATPATAAARKPDEFWQARCAVASALDRTSGGPSRVNTCGLPGEPAWWPVARAVDVQAQMPGSEVEKARRLSGFLNHASPQVRARAAEALGELDTIKAPDASQMLADRLADETDAGTAVALASSLGDHAVAAHGPQLRKALLRFVGKPGDALEAATAIAQCLGTAHVSEAAADVAPLLQSPSAHARRVAAAALVGMGQPSQVVQPVAPPIKADRPETLPTRATLRTGRGDVVLRFYRDDAPLTVTNFVTLARKGFYKNLPFHRVVADFVVQGGDPRGDGNGGPGYAIPCEYNPRPYERGVVGMALGGKDTGGSQFFITHSPQPHLDGLYTAFAEVESGMDVVDALQVGDVLLDVTVN